MRRYWTEKFRQAIGGMAVAFRRDASFRIHLPAAAAVVIMAAALGVKTWEWCVLVLCIAIVIAAELFNTAIEILVRRLHPERHDQVGQALDIAAAAVLVVALGAASIGLITLGGALLRLISS